MNKRLLLLLIVGICLLGYVSVHSWVFIRNKNMIARASKEAERVKDSELIKARAAERKHKELVEDIDCIFRWIRFDLFKLFKTERTPLETANFQNLLRDFESWDDYVLFVRLYCLGKDDDVEGCTRKGIENNRIYAMLQMVKVHLNDLFVSATTKNGITSTSTSALYFKDPSAIITCQDISSYVGLLVMRMGVDSDSRRDLY